MKLFWGLKIGSSAEIRSRGGCVPEEGGAFVFRFGVNPPLVQGLTRLTTAAPGPSACSPGPLSL